MTFYDRLMYFAKNQGFKTPTSLSRELGYNSPEKLTRLGRDENAKPSFDVLADIADRFAGAPLRWLITGKYAENDNTPPLLQQKNNVNEPPLTYTLPPQEVLESPNSEKNASATASPKDYNHLLLAEKERVIEAQKELIESQKQTISLLIEKH